MQLKTLLSCNSTYRLRYWNSKSKLSKAILFTSVATVLTVYGIETKHYVLKASSKLPYRCNSTYRLRYWNQALCALGFEQIALSLQQYLPFTVLKRVISLILSFITWSVATVLTVYGIETPERLRAVEYINVLVATVLTVYGIETNFETTFMSIITPLLQQYLPFTVLKLLLERLSSRSSRELQQYLPFTVLKLFNLCW